MNYEIIEKTSDYQTVRISTSSKTVMLDESKIYIVDNYIENVTRSSFDLNPISNIGNFKEITRVAENAFTLKIYKKDYSDPNSTLHGYDQYVFYAEDTAGNVYLNPDVRIKICNPPKLESGLEPFVYTNREINEKEFRTNPSDPSTKKELGGDANGSGQTVAQYSSTLFDNLDSWYDYTGEKPHYATVIKLKSVPEGQVFTINENLKSNVFVWVPYDLNTKDYLPIERKNDKSGDWMPAEWDNTEERWIPRKWELMDISFEMDNQNPRHATKATAVIKSKDSLTNVYYYYKIERSGDFTPTTTNNNFIEGDYLPETTIQFYVVVNNYKSKILEKDVPIQNNKDLPTSTTSTDVPTINSMEISSDGKSVIANVSNPLPDMKYTFTIKDSSGHELATSTQSSSVYYYGQNIFSTGGSAKVQLKDSEDIPITNNTLPVEKEQRIVTNLVKGFGGFENSGWASNAVYDNSIKRSRKLFTKNSWNYFTR